MIFVTIGSQKFQFNRLLIEIDRLISTGKIDSEKIFAQIGYSDYRPIHYNYELFLDREKFEESIKKSEIVITHGGTGSIISSIKCGKKVIGIPRDKKFGEHIDNHQYEIVRQFHEAGIILGIFNINQLEESIPFVIENEFNQYESNTLKIINIIKDFLSLE